MVRQAPVSSVIRNVALLDSVSNVQINWMGAQPTVSGVEARPGVQFPSLPDLLALRGRAGQPGPRAENRERGKTEARWNLAIAFPSVPLPENSPESQKAKLAIAIAQGASISTSFESDILDSQAGKPDVRRGTSSWSGLPKLWRPRTLANAAADAPCGGRFRVIRRVPRDGQFRRLKRRWHRDPCLARAAERFGTAVLRDEKALKSGGMRRYNLWTTCRLRSEDLGALHTPQEPGFGSIPNTAKWHKRPQKAATLCHFSAVVHDVRDDPNPLLKPWRPGS